jgi:tetratricopeptide (TPR) repeat protein
VHAGKTGYGVYVGLARIYQRRRLYDQAEEYAQNALNIDSADQNMLDVLFWSRLYRGDVAEAEATARERIEDAPRIAGSYLNLVELHTYLEDIGRADSVLEVALAVEPMTSSQASALIHAAEYALESTRLDRADALARRALALAPDRADAISVLGYALELQGRYEEALEQYAKLDPVPVHIVGLGPAYPPGYLQTGCLYLRRGDYASAEEWFRKAETIDPSNPLTLRHLGYLYNARGKSQEAESYARRALERDSSFFNYALMAWLLAQRGDGLNAAIDLGELALSRPPENDLHDLYVSMLPYVPLPDHSLGRAFFQKSDFERAVMHLQRAADLRPDDEAIASDLRGAKMRLQG